MRTQTEVWNGKADSCEKKRVYDACCMRTHTICLHGVLECIELVCDLSLLGSKLLQLGVKQLKHRRWVGNN